LKIPLANKKVKNTMKNKDAKAEVSPQAQPSNI